MRVGILAALILIGALSVNGPANAQTRIAVASNFLTTANALVEAFSVNNSAELILLSGSTGKHSTQIIQGLPVDLLLAADQQRPARLESLGLIRPNSRKTYAIGQLMYWQPSITKTQRDLFDLSEQLNEISSIAVANPDLAPYGRAAEQVLSNFPESVKRLKLVKAENIAQAFQFVYSGNADAGFIAQSQSFDLSLNSAKTIPSFLHEPIVQQMVLLSDDTTARAFYDFVLSERGQTIIKSHGYLSPHEKMDNSLEP